MMTEYNALSFDGVDDYVEVPAWAEDGQDLSIIVIAYLNSITSSSTAPVFSSYYAGWGFQIFSSKILAKMTVSGAEHGTGIYSGTGFWKKTVMLAETVDYDSANNTTTLVGYFNGQRISSTTVTGAPDRLSGRNWLMNYNKILIAKYYIVLAYSRALSDEEIQQIYNDPMNPPTDGLVLWLAPDSVDTANDIWTDKSGNGNDGTIYGATYVPLRPVSESTSSASAPYGLYFDGVDDYVQTPIKASDFQDVTVIAIVKVLGDTGKYQFFVSGDHRYGFALGYRDDLGYLWYPAILDGGSIVPLGLKEDRSVRFVAGVYDSNAQVARAYIDGVKVEEESMDVNFSATDEVRIGKPSSVNYPPNANIYLILIYNRALSDTEIQQIYDDPMNPPKEGLVLWLSPESLDTANGKWLNRAEILNTGLVEQLDGTIYGTLLIPVRWTTKDGILTIEEIWELNNVRFAYPWPVSITDRVNRTVKIVPTLGGSPVVFDTGLGSEEVTFNFYILPSELATFRDLAQVGGVIKVRTPDLDYYGDYVIKNVDWSIDRMSAYQVRITAVRV